MESKLSYKLTVGSSNEYEELIAEILFPHNFGLIISQEKGEGLFEITVHSFNESAGKDFDYSKNNDSTKIPLDVFNSAINRGVSELKRLAKDRK